MTLMALAALCIASLGSGKPAPATIDCPAIVRQYRGAISQVSSQLLAPANRDAIARVAYAEAGNQGDSGLAGVVYAIVNRLIDGGWGEGVSAILNAPGQFEPVNRVGSWERLAQRSPLEQAHIDTILNLLIDGRLPDPTNGARYFQNPAIVADRVAAGTAKAGVLNFGGRTPVAVIKDHSFFDEGRPIHAAASPLPLVVPAQTGDVGQVVEPEKNSSQPPSLFVPLNH